MSKESDIRTVTERIAEKMYTVVLRELGYAEDFEIAELEIELEAEGQLAEFGDLPAPRLDWRMVRKGAQKLSRASAVLHDLDPTTYPRRTPGARPGKKNFAVTVRRSSSGPSS